VLGRPICIVMYYNAGVLVNCPDRLPMGKQEARTRVGKVAVQDCFVMPKAVICPNRQ